jgi:hypothetical protein
LSDGLNDTDHGVKEEVKPWTRSGRFKKSRSLHECKILSNGVNDANHGVKEEVKPWTRSGRLKKAVITA